ncbi:retrovirus-related pol polyprotein from transposon TNT 1-94 [Tanacetum coccineum]
MDAKGHKVIQSRYATFNEDPLYRDKAATYFSNLTAQKQNDQVALEDSPDNLEENSKIAEHGTEVQQRVQSPTEDAKGHKVIQSRYAIFNKDPLYRDKATTYFSNLTAQKQNDQVALEDCTDNLEENTKIAEHGLISENTQISGGSLDTSGGYESSRSSHSSRRSDNEDRDIDVVKAIFVTLQQMSSLEKNQTWSLVGLPAGKKALQSKWVVRVKEEQDGSKRSWGNQNQAVLSDQDLHYERYIEIEIYGYLSYYSPESCPSIALMYDCAYIHEKRFAKKNDVKARSLLAHGTAKCASLTFSPASKLVVELGISNHSSQACTNTINTVNTGVSTRNTKVNTASTETSTASFSDATVMPFCAHSKQGSQTSSMRSEQKPPFLSLMMIRREIGSTKCSSKAVRIEDASEKEMCAIDGARFDWSDMAEMNFQANLALMASQILRPTPLDLSYSGLQEFKQPEVNEYGLRDSSVMPITGCDKESDNSKENTDDSLKQQQKTDSSLSNSQLNDKGFVDSGCSRHMSGNIAHLLDFKDFDGGYVTFGGGANGGRITGKGTIKTDKLDFEDVYFVKELKFNLFSVSQICDKTNYVLFTDSKFPKDGLTCLVAKATSEESMLWHRRLGHVNFKNINKLVKENLVRDLPLKRFENDQTCVACLKGKQHRVSCKTKAFSPITKPLFMLHMDLFGPTFVSSLMHKKYCLVVTDDYSRFSWVFFLRTKDETSEILKNFIKEVENLVDKKVKIIRSDNGTEFKNHVMDEFCREKGIKREYSVARTPQQNGVAERKNRTLIEAARTMLADSKLPTTFWAEAVSTACYVQNRVLIVKPHNKTPYELFRGIKPAIGFMKPFGCHVTILNTLDKLGKFDGKSDEGFFVGYSLSSKAFRVYNIRTRKVQENLHVGFLENKPMVEGNGPKWLFDLDSLTQSMNYVPVVAGTFSNDFAGIQGVSESSTSSQQDQDNQDCIVMPIWKDASYFDDASPRSVADAQLQDQNGTHDDCSLQNNGTADQQVNTASPEVNTGSRIVSTAVPEVNTATPEDLVGPSSTFEEEVGEQEIELGNISPSYAVPTTPHTRVHKDHPIDHVIGDVQSSVQTRRMTTSYSELGFLGAIYEGKTHQDLHTCLFACFLSQEEPKRVSKALSDPAWVEAMQEELLQFKLQKVWVLVDLPKGHRAIGTKWVYKNKAFYQMDVKSAFLYGQIEEEVYVCQPPGFEDPDHLDKVYKVVKVLYGLHQAPRAWYDTLATYLLSNGFQRGQIDQTLFIKSQKGHILLVQIYVDDIIFGSTKKELCEEFEKLMKDKFLDEFYGRTYLLFGIADVKSASTPTDLEKPLVKDGDADDVDEHLYRSMIGVLMYLNRHPDQISCLQYVHVQGLWYSKDSPLELVAYTDSDYAGATLDRKSTTGGCQFLGNRLISWQCKKQTVVATSTTEAEYVAAASCCGQLDDQDGVTSLPNSEIFEQLALMGYHTNSDKLTFQKGAFSPQWRFLIHCILHCISPKKTIWEQFSSNIAIAVICLATNRKFNFSRMIFEHMVSNISSPHKFLMYPRGQQRVIQARRMIYSPTMLDDTAPSTSPSRITSSPSHSPEHSPSPTPLPSPEPTPDHTTCLMVMILDRQELKIGKARRQARVVLSDDEDIADDSSKQGRKLSDVEVQEKASNETEPVIQDVTPTEVIQDQESSEKGSAEVSTAGAKQGTASEEVPIVSAAEEEPKKKSTKELKQERLSYAEAIRLEEQMNEEQRAQIARDEEIVRQWDEEERKRSMEVKTKSPEKEKSLLKRLWKKRDKSWRKIAEKEDSKDFLILYQREEVPIEVESISTKFPIVDWKTCVLTETFMYYQVFRGDGNSKNYKILSEMLEDFDRLDVEELYRLVKERYSTSRPEGFDLMLWGDLHTLFEPDEDDEIGRDQHE